MPLSVASLGHRGHLGVSGRTTCVFLLKSQQRVRAVGNTHGYEVQFEKRQTSVGVLLPGEVRGRMDSALAVQLLPECCDDV